MTPRIISLLLQSLKTTNPDALSSYPEFLQTLQPEHLYDQLLAYDIQANHPTFIPLSAFKSDLFSALLDAYPFELTPEQFIDFLRDYSPILTLYHEYLDIISPTDDTF